MTDAGVRNVILPESSALGCHETELTRAGNKQWNQGIYRVKAIICPFR